MELSAYQSLISNGSPAFQMKFKIKFILKMKLIFFGEFKLIVYVMNLVSEP